MYTYSTMSYECKNYLFEQMKNELLGENVYVTYAAFIHVVSLHTALFMCVW